MNKKVLSVSRMPSAGLGNKLFCWAAGMVFSKKNNCAHYITGLTRLHVGPFVRREKSKRFYKGYFLNERLISPFSTLLWPKYVIPQKHCDQKINKPGVYYFEEIPHWKDHFVTLKNYRPIIKEAFWKTLTSKIISKVNGYSTPVIGIHIRMGDFRTLTEGEDFSKTGGARTPLDYFESAINKIRNILGDHTPVSVFSDGKNEELSQILNLKNVKRVPDDLDIVHLALLSKSKVIIMSAGSTFSFWAGFLSDGILVNHYQHLHAPFRPESFNKQMYEGGIAPEQNIEDISLLYENLLSLKSDLN